MRTSFRLFRQIGKRTAEHDQIPVGKRLPQQGVMQQLKLLTDFTPEAIERLEPYVEY